MNQNNSKNNVSGRSDKAYISRTTARRGEAARRARILTADITTRSSQHLTSLPVNKSIYNGREGKQLTAREVTSAQRNPHAVRVIPIGGLAEGGIGNNMTAIEYGDEIIIIDMGSIFPSGNDYPGVSLMTPDSDYVRDNKHKIKAILFTHSHLDHIGACRFLLPEYPAPIYGTKFTLEMIKRQMREAENQAFTPDYNVIDPFKHERVKVGEHFEIEFVHVLHSTPGCVAIIIRTPNGTIVHMGDWRFESEPIRQPFDTNRLMEIAESEGIALMLNESTNIDIPGTHPHSEQTVAKNIGVALDTYRKSRAIITCFSSQVHRIQLVLDEVAKRGRKVAFAGYSMISTIETAIRSGEVKVPKDLVVTLEDAAGLPDSQVTIICTGSQGEANAVLHRMATGSHRTVKIKAPDCVIMSSSPIPGNEPSVAGVVSNLLREGATVIQNGRTHQHGIGPIYLSGHAYYEDHVRLVAALKPHAYMPIHGEFYMLQHNAEMAERVAGIPRQRILVVDDGDIVELAQNGAIRHAGRVPTRSILRDRNGQRVNEIVVRDRLLIGTEGICVVVATISKSTGKLLKPVDIVSRACVYMRDHRHLYDSIRSHVRLSIERSDRTNTNTLREQIHGDIQHIIYDMTKNNPLVQIIINRV